MGLARRVDTHWRESYVKSLLFTCSLCVFCTDSDCCVGSTLLPPFDEPDGFCVCEFRGLGSFQLNKIHPCSHLIFLLVYIVDIVLDVRHCTLCCPGLAVLFTLSIVLICYLKCLNGCSSFRHNSHLSSTISSTDLIDKKNCSWHHGTMF